MTRLLFLLIFVVALSWGLLAVGVTRSNGSIERVSASLERSIGAVLRMDLEMSDLSTTSPGCSLSGRRVALASRRTCRLRVGEGGFRVRVARISIGQGQGEARFEPADDGETRVLQPEEGRHRLPQDGAFELSVFSDGGVLELRCPSDRDCRFTLRRAQ